MPRDLLSALSFARHLASHLPNIAGTGLVVAVMIGMGDALYQLGPLA